MTSKLLLQPQLPLPALHLVVQLLESLRSMLDYQEAAPQEKAMLPLHAASVGLAQVGVPVFFFFFGVHLVHFCFASL